MTVYERSESAQDNFGIFIHHVQTKTKTFVRKLKRILIKLYRQNVSLLSNKTSLNEGQLPHTHTHTYIYIYIYIYICVCVCVCVVHSVTFQTFLYRHLCYAIHLMR